MLTEICVALNICIKKKRNFSTQYSKILPKETSKRRANETHGKQKKEKKWSSIKVKQRNTEKHQYQKVLLWQLVILIKLLAKPTKRKKEKNQRGDKIIDYADIQKIDGTKITLWQWIWQCVPWKIQTAILSSFKAESKKDMYFCKVYTDFHILNAYRKEESFHLEWRREFSVKVQNKRDILKCLGKNPRESSRNCR